MSRSPHRLRGDPAECWQAILFGEILREFGGPAILRDSPTIRLPRSGRWESGLGRVTPALDDALGATAFAIAWRWACVELQANAWPGWSQIARHAIGEHVVETSQGALAHDIGKSRKAITGVPEGTAPRSWRLLLPTPVAICVSDGRETDWTEVDRLADVVASWLDVSWEVVSTPHQASRQGRG